MMLAQMQALLARLYDAPVVHRAQDFLISDRARLRQLLGGQADELSDEQVFVVQEGQGLQIGLFIDGPVLDRLAARDPLQSLDDDNLPDFCTALEGVSHFHYLMWNAVRGREVSLLELEVQAEVDKYASALTLLTQQRAGQFPSSLHARLFDRISYVPQLDAPSRQRYEEANRRAAHYCRWLEQSFLHRQRLRPESWLMELRRFFRRSHQEKMRHLTVAQAGCW